MTTRLYFDSAYLTEWRTRISQTLEREDGIYVILEETAFYPHGGGQPCDDGWINGIPVLDVISEENNVILHKVERLPEGAEASCEIGWSRRFDHMQQHSGQHLLSAICRDLYGAMTVSFHMGTDYCSIDVEKPELNSEEMNLLENEINRHIYLNHVITGYFVTGEEAAKLPLAKRPKVSGGVRIVEMKDVEYNACGGTHVSSTGEIGMIKLLKAEKQKGNTRIYFKCGARALAEFNDYGRILNALSVKFKAGKDELIERIEKWEMEQQQLHVELAVLKEKNDDYTVRELMSKREGRMIACVFTDRTLKDALNLALKLTGEHEGPVLFATAADHKVILAHNGSFSVSCGAFYKEHLGNFGGKGGGSDRQAQAGFSVWEDARRFYEFARQSLC